MTRIDWVMCIAATVAVALTVNRLLARFGL